MGLFDKDENKDISFPEPPSEDVTPAFPEPPKDDLKSVKESVESPEEEEGEEAAELLEEEMEMKPETQRPIIPEATMPTTISPTLYIKLSEYKEVVEATNKMRKDIEKAKSIVTELRSIEKDEHSRLEKSEELIKDIDKIISLFEKTMVTPIE
jgi:hypothetical protein